MPVAGYRTIVEGLVKIYQTDGAALGSDRAINLPSIDVSVAEMIAALKRAAAGCKLGAIRVERDPAIERIVATWPVKADFERAFGPRPATRSRPRVHHPRLYRRLL